MMRAFVIAAAAAASAQAQVWTEHGDAGNLPATAQVTVGEGALREIRGAVGGGEDMYCIRIHNVAEFIATTVNGASIDTQLFLFRRNGQGVVFSDDAAPGNLQSTITGQFLQEGGIYLLAISQYDDDALDGDGREIWADSPFAGERAPDGPGAGHAIHGWSGHAEEPLHEYTIFLRGASFCEVPAPGTLALLGLGVLAHRGRRR